MANLSPVRKSVRRRLLILLTCSLLMLVAGATMVTYWIAVRAANAAYDRALLDPAVDLSDNIRVESGTARLELSRDAQDALMYDQSDKVVFQIRDSQGRIVAGDPFLPEVGGLTPGTRMYFDGKHQGQSQRFVAMRTPSGYLVQVGETLNKRQHLVRDVLVAELVPTLLIALAAIAVAWIAVTHGLAPLERVRAKLLHRSPQNLEPLDEADAPDEMAPAVQALNRLLERARAANAVQQRFLVNSAHQLRTPLAGLQMHMELFLRRPLAPELVPTLLIALAAIAVAWIAVTHGLAPLERVRAKLLHRSPQNLEPLDEADAPDEMAPAVQALNRLLERARAANAVQQRFLVNSAHQLRTPLAGLQMHMELFLRRPLAPELRMEVERMHKATIRTARLANQLLALANVESASEQRPELVPVDLKDIADAAAREWVPRALSSNIDLGFSLDAALVMGDSLLLQQMLNNLVDNALRYTPSSGTVTVRTGTRGNLPFVSVEDTGSGIPAWARAKVVERFFRVDGTLGEGSGLGLAIVKEVVDLHHGTLTIESAHRESGTRIIAAFQAMSPPTGNAARA